MSAPIDDGGPAFPYGQTSEVTGQFVNGWGNPGMTLRDWFAGQALAGLCANPKTVGLAREVAECALIHADEMIAARGAK